jgi:hypothetical protein
LTFSVHRAPPSILTVTTFKYSESMSMHSFHNIGWGEELELSVPLDMKLVHTQPVMSITLSNGQYVILSQEDVLEKAGKNYWVDCLGEGEPGRLMVQFDCFGGNDLAKKKILGKNWKVRSGEDAILGYRCPALMLFLTSSLLAGGHRALVRGGLRLLGLCDMHDHEEVQVRLPQPRVQRRGGADRRVRVATA